MKEVTVYTVQAHQTLATDGYIAYYRQFYDQPLIGIGDDDSKTFIVPDHIELPVHHVCRRVMSADGTRQRREEFLAIDRDLLRVLEMVVRSDANELRQQVADLRERQKGVTDLQQRHDHLTALYYDLESRQDAFREAPLWRRLWIAIRPGRYFT